MLWLALHFRHLPLEVFTRGAPPDAHAFAVTSGAETGAFIVAANRPAQAQGVQPGMSVSSACALSAGLQLMARDTARERATLARIAAWSLQFTSLASLAEPDGVLLEIEGSLKLFGGLNKLYRHIARGVAELGFDASLACAPTPLAAQWFARAGISVRVQHADALAHALEQLPAAFICDTAATRDLLDSFGAQTLGDCLRLPRAGLARRAGPRLLDQLGPRAGHASGPAPAVRRPANVWRHASAARARRQRQRPAVRRAPPARRTVRLAHRQRPRCAAPSFRIYP